MKTVFCKTTFCRSSYYRRLLNVLFAVLLTGAATTPAACARTPTPGLIFKPATAGNPGAAVLDPNGDGYVSASATGFTAAGDLGALSEISYKYLPHRIPVEPMNDLRVGPATKFTDFADVAGGGSSVGFFVQPNVPAPATPTDHYYMFRFRLGGSAPNSKGYSIAIDTDNKFGFTGTNADPNAVTGNPGFEMEILLASNFGVRLYNIDGTATPNGPGPDGSLIQLAYDSYAQKAVAATTNDGDLDVFYDFYIPLSVIQAQFGSRTFFSSTGASVPFSLDTPLRMVANTIIAPHSVTKYQNISDIGGLNNVSNTDLGFIDLISGTTPTSGNTLPPGNVILPRTATAPVVSSPIQTGSTTVSGTSTEAAGTIIRVYINGVAHPTTTTVSMTGTWSLTVPALANGALVKATATATDKTESVFSNEVQAAGTPVCATPGLATPNCFTDRGISGNAPAGSIVYLRYLDGTLVPTSTSPSDKLIEFNPVVTSASGIYILSSNGGTNTCTNGQTGVLTGSYLISVAPGNNGSPTGCESAGREVCIGSFTANTPTMTTPLPITSATTSISGTVANNTGQTVISPVIRLYVDGVLFSSVTGSAFTNTTATGTSTFTFSGASLPALTTGRVLTFQANVRNVACNSGSATLNVVAARTVAPPVVNSGLVSGPATITGTSSEAAGSIIRVTVYSDVNGGGIVRTTATTTVLANGTWSVVSPVSLANNNSVVATVTPPNYNTSGLSNYVNVQPITPAPTITGSYTPASTSVTGAAASPAGSIVTVYIDGGDPIGTATVVAVPGVGNRWELTGIAPGTLYAGGVLTATATTANQQPSALSNAVTVGCATIANKSFATSAICAGNAATFTVSNVEPGVVYTLQDNASNATVAASKVGTGTGTSSLTFTTPVYSTAGSYPVKLNAFSIGATNCTSTTAPTTLTVNPLPLTRTISGTNTITTAQAAKNGVDIVVQSSETNISYQLVNTSVTPNANVGTPRNGTGSNLNLYTGPISTTSNSTTYSIIGTNTLTNCQQTIGSRTITYNGPLPVELSYFEAKANNGTAALAWRTASEKNNDHFTVERSVDGREFMAIGQVAGQGTSSRPHAYTFQDAGAARFGSRVYYRLQQVDTDGSTSVSPVRAVAFAEGASPATVLLYPNPATTSVTCSLALLPAGTYSVQVLSMTGKTVHSTSLTAEQSRELDLTDLPAGVYVVRVQGGGLNLSQRLVRLR